MNRLRILMVFAIGGVLCSPAIGQDCVTTVPGGPIVDETWTQAGSPYCITGDVFISNLTIEPGVTVLIDGPWRLNVQTIILAEGTTEEPIVFTAKDPDASMRKGMEFFQTVPGSMLRHCTFSHANDSALRVIESSPMIEHCKFENNSAPFRGGAIYADLQSETLSVTYSQFRDNETNAAGAGGSSYGGAIYVSGSIQMANCVLDSNVARARTYNGHRDAAAGGGGIAVVGGDAMISLCVLRDNLADCRGNTNNPRTRGGGFYIGDGLNATIKNVVIGRNRLYGDNIHFEESGGGIYVASGAITLTHVTIARNQRPGLHVAGGDVTVRNSILWENNGGGVQIAGEVCVDYSVVHNGYDGDCAGDNIIEFNPAFAGPGSSLCDLTILPGSPCIDAGDPDGPEDCDGGADPPAPPYGEARADIGAHGGECACDWGIPLCPSPANINGDCRIDADDFFAYLDLFAAGDPRADVDGDGDIDAEDFFSFLDHFAQGCP